MSNVSKLRGKFQPVKSMTFKHNAQYVVRDMRLTSIPALFLMRYDAGIKCLIGQGHHMLHQDYLVDADGLLTAIAFDEFNAILDST